MSTIRPSPIRVLILGYVWPEPESSAAGRREWNLIDAFRRAGWDVTYGAPSKENEHSLRLREAGLRTVAMRANDSSWDEWIAAERFDFAVFDRFVIEEQFGWRFFELSPETIRVLDTQDLHLLRRAREAAVSEGTPLPDVFNAKLDLFTEDACREIAAILRSDLTLILSDFEVGLLLERFGVPARDLELSRFGYPPPDSSTPGFAERAHFAVIGNFRHSPNADGAFWLKRSLWPRIRAQLPRAQVHLYGAYPPREIMELHAPDEGFHVRGPARDALAMFRAYRVNLAPLRFGAGIKGKLADGWWSGTPAVSTPIGAEGMTIDPRGHSVFGGLIARDEEEFARAAARLYTDPVEWEVARERGWRAMRELFDFESNADALLRRLEDWRRNRETRRREARPRSFLELMALYHSRRDMKYFSKWIEAKGLVSRLQIKGA